MKEKKRSAASWILEWAGQKRSAYVWSVVLAVGNVIFKIIPYFIIANVVTMFLDGSKEFKEYLIMAIWIALSFIIAELFHSLFSHNLCRAAKVCNPAFLRYHYQRQKTTKSLHFLSAIFTDVLWM